MLREGALDRRGAGEHTAGRGQGREEKEGANC
jgi:hypothetical protein